MPVTIFDGLKKLIAADVLNSIGDRKVHLAVKVVDIAQDTVSLEIGYMDERAADFIGRTTVIAVAKNHEVHIMKHTWFLKDLVEVK